MKKTGETNLLYFIYRQLQNDPFWVTIMKEANDLDVCNFYLRVAALTKIGFIDYKKITGADTKIITDFINLHPNKKQIDIFLCDIATN